MAFVNPATLTASRQGGDPTKIDLVWDSVGVDNNGFEIYRRENGLGSFVLHYTVPGDIGFGTQPFGTTTFGQGYSTATEWTDEGVSPTTSYEYEIRVLELGTGITPGTFSNMVVAQLNSSYAERIGHDIGIIVLFEPDIINEDNYKIYHSQDGGGYVFLDTVAADTTTYLHAAAAPMATHRYKISVVVDGNEGPQSAESNLIEKAVPLPVSDVVATKTAGKAIEITWTNNEEGDGIRIYRAENGAPMSLTPIYDTANASTASYIDSGGLDVGGTRYRYWVAQYTVSGETKVYSNEETIVDDIEFIWTRGSGSQQDEYFELAKKRSDADLNTCDNIRSLNFSLDSENSYILRDGVSGMPRKAWAVLDEQIDLDYTETNTDRAEFYVYSVRARDHAGNFSRRVVRGVQV